MVSWGFEFHLIVSPRGHVIVTEKQFYSKGGGRAVHKLPVRLLN